MNKHKIIRKLTALALLSCFFLSCNKKNLDINPFSITENDYFTKETEFTRGIIGVYAKLTDLYWYNAGSSVMELQYLPADDVTTTSSRALEHFGSLAAGNTHVTYFYTRVYRMIARANIMLEKINAENGVYKTPNLKNYHKGEVLFLRALGNYWLWNFYGTPPLLLDRVTDPSQFNQANSQENQLLDQAILDFAEAANLLPASWPATDRGRATKNAALAFQGKCLVFRGTIKNATADFQAATQVFTQISGAALMPNFSDNFAVTAENNAESLFEFQASRPNGIDNVFLENDFNDAVGSLSTYWGYFYPGNGNGQNSINFIATDKLINAYTAGDRRRDSTVSIAGKLLWKYTRRDQFTQSNIASYNNPRILRYADVLLLHAEALIKSNGSTSAAIDLVNQVRTRARVWGGGTEPANYSNAETNTTTIMNWIMNERFLELAGEGQRWFDLRRWHKAGLITLNNAFFDPANTAPMSFDASKHLLMPIPSSETSVNPNIIQNSGY